MRKKHQVFYTPQAYSDLKDIYSYIALDLQSEQNAKGQVNSIRKAIKKLNVFPEKHEVVDWEPWMSMGMRKLPIDNYIAFYAVDSDRMVVTVVRIFYGGRNIEEIINND